MRAFYLHFIRGLNQRYLELNLSYSNFEDQEIKFLQQEILKLNENMEVIKKDRIRDQKVIK